MSSKQFWVLVNTGEQLIVLATFPYDSVRVADIDIIN